MFDPPKPPKVKGTMHPRFDEILTPEALAFVAKLDGAAAGRRAELLAARRERGKRISAGEPVDFLTGDRRHPRGHQLAGRAAGAGPGRPALRDHRPDQPEDEHQRAELRRQGVDGRLRGRHRAELVQHHRRPAQPVRRHPRATWTSPPRTARSTRSATETPTIVVRPRGWRLCEKHLSIDGRPLPASLVDFGLFFFHNAQALIDGGAGPYFYLPKLESHLEARLWNDVFVQAQALLGIPQGTIRATVLIETLPAAFEMEEILYELRDHSSGPERRPLGLHLQLHQDLRPPRRRVRAAGPLADHHDHPVHAAYTELLVSTCHRRGAHAIGGMAAFVPNKADPRSPSRRWPRSRPTRSARPATASTAPGWRTRAWCPTCIDGLRPRCSATGRTSWTSSGRTCTSPPPI